MEGEIVECLTRMDEPTTAADHFAIMKQLRHIQELLCRLCPLRGARFDLDRDAGQVAGPP